MSGNFYTDFIYFMLYSFLGWCCEVFVCSVEEKRFVNRGFLLGPICPIYGCGALIAVGLLSPYASRPWLVFLMGMLLAGVLEYATSYVMERLFHNRWWDYTGRFLSLNGRVCLTNLLAFGAMMSLCLYLIHPWMVRLVGLLSYFWIQVLAVVILMVLSSDITLTLQSMAGLTTAMKRIKEELQESISNVQQTVERTRQQLESTSMLYRHNYIRLVRAFPTMRSDRYDRQISDLKEAIELRKQEKIRKRQQKKLQNKKRKEG